MSKCSLPSNGGGRPRTIDFHATLVRTGPHSVERHGETPRETPNRRELTTQPGPGTDPPRHPGLPLSHHPAATAQPTIAGGWHLSRLLTQSRVAPAHAPASRRVFNAAATPHCAAKQAYCHFFRCHCPVLPCAACPVLLALYCLLSTPTPPSHFITSLTTLAPPAPPPSPP